MQTKNKDTKENLINWAYHLWCAIVYKKYRGKCIKCGNQACDAHHIFPKGSYPHLKYETLNGVMLCRDHHDLYHFSQDKAVINSIMHAIGVQGYSELLTMSKNKPSLSNADLDNIIAKLTKEAIELGILD